jgi:PAS domain-containing protein
MVDVVFGRAEKRVLVVLLPFFYLLTLRRFQRFAERADIGIFILDMDGVYSYRNEAWYSILVRGSTCETTQLLTSYLRLLGPQNPRN